MSLIVIVATKNRSDEIEQYALSSLERSVFRDFVCVIWDASDDERTRRIVESGKWTFPLEYFKAPRSGLTSQRNDAVDYVLKSFSNTECLLFIDDDSELANDALQGLLQSFGDGAIWGVNIPHVAAIDGANDDKSFSLSSRSRIMTSYLHNRSTCPEAHGIDVEWLSGCSMAFRRNVFDELGLRFPEEFQRFGGYALGEDVALSYYLYTKMNKKLINSVLGTLCHHAAKGARLNIINMAASKWYNFHLLFDCIYDDVRGMKRLWLRFKFKLFMIAAALKLLLRVRSPDVIALFRGIGSARAALREFHANRSIQTLFHRNGRMEEN